MLVVFMSLIAAAHWYSEKDRYDCPALDRCEFPLTIHPVVILRELNTEIELCRMTGPDADKVMAKYKATAEEVQSSLNEEHKKLFAAQREMAEALRKAEWEKTPRKKRTQKCIESKERVAKEAAK